MLIVVAMIDFLSVVYTVNNECYIFCVSVVIYLSCDCSNMTFSQTSNLWEYRWAIPTGALHVHPTYRVSNTNVLTMFFLLSPTCLSHISSSFCKALHFSQFSHVRIFDRVSCVAVCLCHSSRFAIAVIQICTANYLARNVWEHNYINNGKRSRHSVIMFCEFINF